MFDGYQYRPAGWDQKEPGIAEVSTPNDGVESRPRPLWQKFRVIRAPHPRFGAA